MNAVGMQVERLRNGNGHSWSTDIHFLLVALRRLERAATLAKDELPAVQDSICEALTRFEAALPGYVVMRNASEHSNDYVMGRGREDKIGRQWVQNVRRSSLQSFSFDGATVEWLGVYDDGPVEVFAPVSESDERRRIRINIETAFDAAMELSLLVRALHQETQA